MVNPPHKNKIVEVSVIFIITVLLSTFIFANLLSYESEWLTFNPPNVAIKLKCYSEAFSVTAGVRANCFLHINKTQQVNINDIIIQMYRSNETQENKFEYGCAAQEYKFIAGHIRVSCNNTLKSFVPLISEPLNVRAWINCYRTNELVPCNTTNIQIFKTPIGVMSRIDVFFLVLGIIGIFGVILQILSHTRQK